MWQPTISLDNLKKRAALLNDIRAFFFERNILEVETPLLSLYSVTEPSIQSIPAQLKLNSLQEKIFYLQTSPEYAMKRLLASETGCIYQICKAFRQSELGKFHQPEFTMLEWYRINFTDKELMQEVDAFLQTVANAKPAEFISYQTLFLTFLNIDPFEATLAELQKTAKNTGISWENDTSQTWTRDDYLNLLMSHHIEPQLGKRAPVCVYDFPASQAALARIDQNNPQVAKRFEFYWQGLELANGFYELNDVKQQRKRFLENNAVRRALGLPEMELDTFLLQALEYGLPDCAGVALGIDRLFMVMISSRNIKDVIAFGV